MKNGVGREIPNHFNPFVNSSDYKNHQRKLIEKKKQPSRCLFFDGYEDVFNHFNIPDGQTLSFHHHLRNGDQVIQDVCAMIKKSKLKNMHVAPSSIFPSYTNMVDLILSEQITDIDTNYINGPVAKVVSEGHLKGRFIDNGDNRGMSVHVKEEVGVVVAKLHEPFIMFAINESNMTAAFWDYMESEAERLRIKKDLAIERLGQLIEKIQGKEIKRDGSF